MRLGFGDVQLREKLKESDFASERGELGSLGFCGCCSVRLRKSGSVKQIR